MEQQDRIDQLVAENQELLALTKQAFIKREVENESVPVDEEWQKFAVEHADELEALEKDEPHTATIKKLMGIFPYKVAASIIGRSGFRCHPHCAYGQPFQATSNAGRTNHICQAYVDITNRHHQNRHDNQYKAHCFRQCCIG